jgi:hypothetical protein
MIAFLAGAYVGGFIVAAACVKGGRRNKLGTAAIWPLFLLWVAIA